MAWQETYVMQLKEELINRWLKGDSKIELSRTFQLSRPTVDKWLKRYHEQGFLKSTACLMPLKSIEYDFNHDCAVISP